MCIGMFETKKAAQAQPTEKPTEDQAQPKQAQTPTEVESTEALCTICLPTRWFSKLFIGHSHM
jgi:hypothetical protein